MTLTIACATDDGKKLVNRHFGDANQYDIYNADSKGFKFLYTINNTKKNLDDIEGGSHSKKAKGMGELLIKNNVNVILGNKIGLNITKMRKNFVPIVSRDRNLKKSLERLCGIYLDELGELPTEIKKHFILEHDENDSVIDV